MKLGKTLNYYIFKNHDFKVGKIYLNCCCWDLLFIDTEYLAIVTMKDEEIELQNISLSRIFSIYMFLVGEPFKFVE